MTLPCCAPYHPHWDFGGWFICFLHEVCVCVCVCVCTMFLRFLVPAYVSCTSCVCVRVPGFSS